MVVYLFLYLNQLNGLIDISLAETAQRALDSMVRDEGLLIFVPTAHMLVTGTWWVFRKL